MSEVEWAVLGYDKKDKSEFIDRTPESREEAESQIARFYSRPSQYRDVRVVSRTVGEWGTPSSGVTEGKAESGAGLEAAARAMHEVSEMRMYTWERAGASRRHGQWHEVMRERAQKVIDAFTAAQPPAPADEGKAESGERNWYADGYVQGKDEGYKLGYSEGYYLGGRNCAECEAKLYAPQPPAPADDAATVLAGLRELDDTQAKVHEWSVRNFGELKQSFITLGLAEETGELCRAVLKREQKVRGTAEEWTAEIRKEIGDCLIKLLDIAAYEGMSASELLAERWAEVRQRDWRANPNGHGLPVEAAQQRLADRGQGGGES